MLTESVLHVSGTRLRARIVMTGVVSIAFALAVDCELTTADNLSGTWIPGVGNRMGVLLAVLAHREVLKFFGLTQSAAFFHLLLHLKLD